MRKMTEDNLRAAFAGESQAHMKYLAFAENADREYPNIARLFRATAYAEQIHAAKHLKNLSGIGSVIDNLTTAIGGETFEVEEMYPAYRSVAELQSEKAALQGINWALEAEKTHAELFAGARRSAETGVDAAVGTIHVCSLCGYTTEGEVPDKCPICNAPSSRFHAF